MRVLVMISLALTSLSAPALATGAPAEKKVCKRVQEQATGSNLRRGPRKVCRSAAEWKEMEEALERELQEIANSRGPEGLSSGAGAEAAGSAAASTPQ